MGLVVWGVGVRSDGVRGGWVGITQLLRGEDEDEYFVQKGYNSCWMACAGFWMPQICQGYITEFANPLSYSTVGMYKRGKR